MADTGIFATTAEVQRYVPANASATANTEAYINQYMTEAESQINVKTIHNWSDAFSGLDVDVKGILKQAAATYAAIKVIQFDFTGFQDINSAITHINSLLFLHNDAMKELENKSKTNKFILGV